MQQAIITTQEEEREVLANNLHDDLGPQFSILYRKLNIQHQNGKAVFNEEELADILAKLDGLMIDIRKYTSDIYPTQLKKLGLIKSIESQFNDLKSNLNVTFRADIDRNLTLDIAFELTIYRIINEVLNNILKHAEASLIEGNVEIESDYLQIHIIHNGKPFSQEHFMEQVRSGKGKGCSSIYNRTLHLNGTIEFFRILGQLSNVKIQIPLA
jgi:signal transduction histidine kinase